MKKILVTIDNLAEYICRLDKKIYVDNTMILTPGAKDELSKQGICIVRDSCPEATGCTAHGTPAVDAAHHADTDMERLFYGVAAMLQSEYGIKDQKMLKELSLKAANIIKDNI